MRSAARTCAIVWLPLAVAVACGSGEGAAGAPDGPRPQDVAAAAGDVETAMAAEVRVADTNDAITSAALDAVAEDGAAAEVDATALRWDAGSLDASVDLAGADRDVLSDEATPKLWQLACASYAEAVCAAWFACSTVSAHKLFGSVQVCAERYGGTACTARMSSPGATVSAEEVAACAVALRGQSCAERFLGVPSICSWSGTRLAGAACTFDEQCESGRCDLPNGTWCGICKPKLLEGEACASPSIRSCASGLVCGRIACEAGAADGGVCMGGVRWACITPVEVEGRCSNNFECGWDLTCLGGRCVGPRREGQSCTDGSECTYEQNIWCLGDTNGAGELCRTITYAEAGDRCDQAAGLECSAGAICKGADSRPASAGVCSAAVEDGGECEGYSQCMPPSVCVAGRCRTAAEVAPSCR